MALIRSISAISMLTLSLLVVAAAGGYGPYGYGPSNPNVEKPEHEENGDLPITTLGIQGLIYCKNGSEMTPIEGAVARITCVANDERGYEVAPFSILSDATDAKGYYFATLSPSETKHYSRLKECRSFLELCPSETCNVPTDINNGASGALLSAYRPLNNGKMILFSVPPFFFTPQYESHSEPNGY